MGLDKIWIELHTHHSIFPRGILVTNDSDEMNILFNFLDLFLNVGAVAVEIEDDGGRETCEGGEDGEVAGAAAEEAADGGGECLSE